MRLPTLPIMSTAGMGQVQSPGPRSIGGLKRIPRHRQWEPYPLSLRIIKWIKWHLVGNELDSRISHSLAVQVRFLMCSLEYHILEITFSLMPRRWYLPDVFPGGKKRKFGCVKVCRFLIVSSLSKYWVTGCILSSALRTIKSS